MIPHRKLMTIGEPGGHTIKETNPPLMPAVLYSELASPLNPKPQGKCGTKFILSLSLSLSLSTICQFCLSLQIHSSVVSPDLLCQSQQREEKPVVPRQHELLIIIFACHKSQKKL
jgi:hypothetical protein